MNVIFRLEDSLRESMIPMFISTDIVSFGMTSSGCVISHDIRDGKQTSTLDVKGMKLNPFFFCSRISFVS